MAGRRILSLWFPRLAAERVLRLRRDGGAADAAGGGGGSERGAGAGVAVGRGGGGGSVPGPGLARCDGDLPCPADGGDRPLGRGAVPDRLRRWAGRFSPWVAEEAPAGLVIDLSGAAHLHGGEEGVLARVAEDCETLGLTVRAGIADTPGAAWALARYARMAAAVRCGRAMPSTRRRGRRGLGRPSGGGGSGVEAPRARWRRGGPSGGDRAAGPDGRGAGRPAAGRAAAGAGHGGPADAAGPAPGGRV
jgi:protein ImuB